MIGFSAEKIKKLQSNNNAAVKRDIERIKSCMLFTARTRPVSYDHVTIRSNDREYIRKELWKRYFLDRGFSIIETTDDLGNNEVRIYWGGLI